MRKPKRREGRITDKERPDFMQNSLHGRVAISSSDSENIITFHAIGSGLRRAIDAAIRAGGKK